MIESVIRAVSNTMGAAARGAESCGKKIHIKITNVQGLERHYYEAFVFQDCLNESWYANSKKRSICFDADKTQATGSCKK